jgi:hypothetical protein
MAKREPNACLSRLIDETGWSQSQFATAVTLKDC